MSKMAIDTNILVHAHNGDNPYHYKAKDFLVNQLQNYPNNICIPYQCLIEFISTVTKRIENPFSIEQALHIIKILALILLPKTNAINHLFRNLQTNTLQKPFV